MSEAQPTKDERVHDLKVWPKFYEAILVGRKQFEIRFNDRDFRVGDVLLLKEFEPYISEKGSHPGGEYTGDQIRRRVTFITDYEQKPGFVVMGFSRE